MQGHHREHVILSCLIATGLAFLAAVLASDVKAATLAVGVAVIGLALAVLTAAVTSDARLAGAVMLWSVFLPAWLVYARESREPWAFRSIVTLAAGAIVLTGLTFSQYRKYVTEGAEARAAAAARAALRERRQWSELLAGLGAAGVTCTSITPTRAGRVVAFTLPKDGSVPLRRLESFADNIAAARRLPPAAVTWTMGAHGGEALLHLDEHDTLHELLRFPQIDPAKTYSINNPIPMFRQPDGRWVALTFREVSLFVSGVTGAGKSNALNVLIGWLTQCSDCVVFVIDLAGGRLAAPWVQPWVEGRCPRPAIDWVATTRAEASEMLNAVHAMMEARDTSLLGGSKITPTVDTPQIVVIVDETADVTGSVPKMDQDGVSPLDMADRAAKLTRRVRKAAIMMVWALTRGTADNTGSTMIKSQCKMRWSMGVSSEIDSRQVTDSNAVARLLAQTSAPGSLIVEYPGHREPLLVKAPRLDPSFPEDAKRIDELATLAGHHRPQPTPNDRAAMAAAYAGHWERSDWYQRLLLDFPHRTGAAPLPPPPGSSPAQEAVAVLDVDQAARAIFEAEGMTVTDNPRERMYAVLAERRMLGMSAMEIAGALGVHRTTVHRWLAEDLDAGRIVKRGEDKQARYFLNTQQA